MLLSIVVPVYNECEVLALFYSKTCGVIDETDGYRFEFIFVDDGSSDKTLSLIHRLAAADARVKYLSFSRNFGKEAAIHAGLTASRGDYVVLMDADLQHPPELLPDMLAALDGGYDSVATRRSSRRGQPVIQSLLARLFYRIMSKLAHTEVVDGAQDFRMMTRVMVDVVLSLKEYHRFSKGIFGWVGFRTKWLEYENMQRQAGRSKWSFWQLLKYAVEGIIAFSTAPLRFAAFFGVCASFISFIYMLYLVGRTISLGVDVPGYASLMVALLLIGGIVLVAIGILGEYVARIYLEVKSRPTYVVRDSNTETHLN